MKEDIFNQYVERVTNLFGISKEDFFSKIKNRDFADARYLVYYLCLNRNIRVMTIKNFMQQNGCDINHQTISHGIKSVTQKIKEDKDYEIIIKDIDKAVFI
jgi:chromosomal replication initiation ATPase DnaA